MCWVGGWCACVRVSNVDGKKGWQFAKRFHIPNKPYLSWRSNYRENDPRNLSLTFQSVKKNSELAKHFNNMKKNHQKNILYQISAKRFHLSSLKSDSELLFQNQNCPQNTKVENPMRSVSSKLVLKELHSAHLPNFHRTI